MSTEQTLPRFAGKVALVTGASSGIGRATAILFGSEGAKVAVVARRQTEGLATVDAIKSAGGEAIFVQADVSRASDCAAAVSAVESAFGGLDIAFNNAGIGRSGRFVADEDEAAWDQVMAINLKGVFLCMKFEIAAMLRRGGGTIINTSSVGGLVAGPGMAAYQASKHGVIGLTKAAALEYATRNLRINAICPGATRSEMVDRWFADPAVAKRVMAAHPIGRIAAPEEIARSVLFLASDAASFITGHALVADGGFVAQ